MLTKKQSTPKDSKPGKEVNKAVKANTEVKDEKLIVTGVTIKKNNTPTKEDKVAKKEASKNNATAVAEVTEKLSKVNGKPKLNAAVKKVTKEQELGNRLNRAKASLAAGLAAAMANEPVALKDPSSEIEKPHETPKPSYMSKPEPVKHAGVKAPGKISFDTLAEGIPSLQVSAQRKPSAGKVSFDTLTAQGAERGKDDFDITPYLKRS